MQNLKVDGGVTVEFAIDFEMGLGRGLDTDMLTLGMDNMSDRVDSTIKEATEAEDNMPPVHGANHRYIQESIICNSDRKLLDTTTVKLTNTNSDTKEQVIVDKLVVDPHLSTRSLMREE